VGGVVAFLGVAVSGGDEVDDVQSPAGLAVAATRCPVALLCGWAAIGDFYPHLCGAWLALQLERGEWGTVLDEVTTAHSGELVTIEVVDPSIGHQYEAERLPFSYLAYDPKDDVVIVGVGGQSRRHPLVLRHMVPHPKEIDVSTQDVRQAAVRVVDPEDTATLITSFPVESRTGSENGLG